MGRGMNRSVLSRFELGDMVAVYLLEEKGCVDLRLVPASKEQEIKELKYSQGECLVQAKILGDRYGGAYAPGTSMRNSDTTDACCYESQQTRQEGDRFVISTVLRDKRGYRYVHELGWRKGTYALDSVTTFINESEAPVTLEMLSSFSISEITPFEEGAAPEHLKIHRIRSKWSAEGRLVTESAEDLQLEPSWAYWQVNSVRYGQLGSMPVKGYFPFGAAEDCSAGVVWAAQLAVETSWQMEFYRRDDGLAFSGGLADREFGHWMKTLAPGESLTAPKAILTVVADDVDCACQRLTQYGDQYVEEGPACEQHLPILFNEYCTTWGLPSHENICSILDAVKGKGLEYFVIDCGWFVEEGKHWANGMGDYVPSDKLFPQGLEQTCQAIRDAGMKPGIWFEIDNVGVDAHVYQQEELLLKRDGTVLTTQNRRFFDMKKPEVQAYLTEKVIGQLQKYGFEYMKMDYNDTIGIGCDGAESLGEGLRQDREASVAFVKKVKEEVPGIILENCASGGHKLEPLMMSLCSMASFSDAHECEEIPVIAAALHRTILPRQSQIWAVIRKTDSVQRIVYTLVNTFLGRMCFSGDVTQLSEAQWKAIEDGMAFYRKIAPIIRRGYSYLISGKGASDRYLTGWQAVVRVKSEEGELKGGKHEAAYVTVHVFHDPKPQQIVIDLPEGCPERIADFYCGTGIEARVENHRLIVTPDRQMEAAAIYFEQ